MIGNPIPNTAVYDGVLNIAPDKELKSASFPSNLQEQNAQYKGYNFAININKEADSNELWYGDLTNEGFTWIQDSSDSWQIKITYIDFKNQCLFGKIDAYIDSSMTAI